MRRSQCCAADRPASIRRADIPNGRRAPHRARRSRTVSRPFRGAASGAGRYRPASDRRARPIPRSTRRRSRRSASAARAATSILTIDIVLLLAPAWCTAQIRPWQRYNQPEDRNSGMHAPREWEQCCCSAAKFRRLTNFFRLSLAVRPTEEVCALQWRACEQEHWMIRHESWLAPNRDRLAQLLTRGKVGARPRRRRRADRRGARRSAGNRHVLARVGRRSDPAGARRGARRDARLARRGLARRSRTGGFRAAAALGAGRDATRGIGNTPSRRIRRAALRRTSGRIRAALRPAPRLADRVHRLGRDGDRAEGSRRVVR